MISPNFSLIAVGVLLAVAAGFGMTIVIRTYIRFCGRRVVTCPESKQPASVHIDLKRLIRGSILGKANLRLDQCSRWPERADCGQDCLSEIKADPENCLVWNMVDEWFDGKSCAYCQKPFGEIHWHDHQPALLGPDRSMVQWNEVPPENLPQIFRTYLPVCWNSFIAEEFRRKNPDRVIDRIGERNASLAYVPKEPESEQGAKPLR
jgi:hypothetical protein